jgi:hypothetical protein
MGIVDVDQLILNVTVPAFTEKFDKLTPFCAVNNKGQQSIINSNLFIFFIFYYRLFLIYNIKKRAALPKNLYGKKKEERKAALFQLIVKNNAMHT